MAYIGVGGGSDEAEAEAAAIRERARTGLAPEVTSLLDKAKNWLTGTPTPVSKTSASTTQAGGLYNTVKKFTSDNTPTVTGLVVALAKVKTLEQAANYAAAGYKTAKGTSAASLYQSAYIYARVKSSSVSTAIAKLKVADKAFDKVKRARVASHDVSESVDTYVSTVVPEGGGSNTMLLLAGAAAVYFLWARSQKKPEGWPKGKRPKRMKKNPATCSECFGWKTHSKKCSRR